MGIQPVRITPLRRAGFTFTGGVITVLLLTPPVWGQAAEQVKPKTPPKVRTTLVFDSQARDIVGTHPAKFQEVRDVPEGFSLEKLKLDFTSADSPRFLAFTGFEIGELDQRFTVD